MAVHPLLPATETGINRNALYDQSQFAYFRMYNDCHWSKLPVTGAQFFFTRYQYHSHKVYALPLNHHWLTTPYFTSHTITDSCKLSPRNKLFRWMHGLLRYFQTFNKRKKVSLQHTTNRIYLNTHVLFYCVWHSIFRKPNTQQLPSACKFLVTVLYLK